MKGNWTSRLALATVAATAFAAAAAAPAGAALKAPSGAECTIRGTPGNDKLRGTPGDDVICGLGGNDVIDGRGGDDVISGGPGRDGIYGGAGRDRLYGGAGDDYFPRDRQDTIADRTRGDLVGDYGVSVRVNVNGFAGQTITTSQGSTSNCTRDESYGPVRVGADNLLILSMTVKNSYGCATQPSNNAWRFALPNGGKGQVNVQRPSWGKDYAGACFDTWTGATCRNGPPRVTITAG